MASPPRSLRGASRVLTFASADPRQMTRMRGDSPSPARCGLSGRVPLRRAALLALVVVFAAACSPGAVAVAPSGEAPASAEPFGVSAAPATQSAPTGSVSVPPPSVPAPSLSAQVPAATTVRTEPPEDEDGAEGSGGVGVGLSVPSVAPSAGPTVAASPEPPAKPFAMNLYHANDWVGQYTLTWCVGASIQMMVNIAEPGQDRTK
jgi:hypothetical protein